MRKPRILFPQRAISYFHHSLFGHRVILSVYGLLGYSISLRFIKLLVIEAQPNLKTCALRGTCCLDFPNQSEGTRSRPGWQSSQVDLRGVAASQQHMEYVRDDIVNMSGLPLLSTISNRAEANLLERFWTALSTRRKRKACVGFIRHTHGIL